MYFTFKTSDKPYQISFNDLLNNFHNLQTIAPDLHSYNAKFFTTKTRYIEQYNGRQLYQKYNLEHMQKILQKTAEQYKDLLLKNMSEHYTTFHIPKATGGMRRIDAPKSELMDALKNIKIIFERTLHVLPHDTAYAYITGRSTKDALIIHQQNQSKWFLKLDIKNFFPSCNYDFILKQLEQLFPFKILLKDNQTNDSINIIIKLCLLNNALPQGTPMSPTLTNLIMLPLDYQIQRTLWNFNKQTFKYTRYADDILISCRYNFNWQEVQNKINEIFQENEAPFIIKHEKTRYGSSSGRNWNLGLMLNKDNKITIGAKRKKRFKAAVFTFFQDLTNGITWDILDVQTLLGQYSYYQKIEPEYINYTVNKYSEEYEKDFKTTLIDIIKKQNQ